MSTAVMVTFCTFGQGFSPSSCIAAMSLRNQGLPWLKQPFARWFYFGQFRPRHFGPLPCPIFQSGLWFLLTSIQPPFLLHTWLLATPRPNPVTIHLNVHTYVDWDECALNPDSIHFAKSTSSADARKPDQTALNADWMRIGVLVRTGLNIGLFLL